MMSSIRSRSPAADDIFNARLEKQQKFSHVASQGAIPGLPVDIWQEVVAHAFADGDADVLLQVNKRMRSLVIDAACAVAREALANPSLFRPQTPFSASKYTMGLQKQTGLQNLLNASRIIDKYRHEISPQAAVSVANFLPELYRELADQKVTAIKDRYDDYYGMNLNLSRFRLVALPESLRLCMTRFSRLDLSHNYFENIPSALSQLRELKFLDMSNNKLHCAIALDLSNFTELETVNLSKNLLSEFPKTLFSLPRLRDIYLDENAIKSVSIAGSPFDCKENLGVLSLRRNGLELIDSLGSFRHVDLSENLLGRQQGSRSKYELLPQEKKEGAAQMTITYASMRKYTTQIFKRSTSAQMA